MCLLIPDHFPLGIVHEFQGWTIPMTGIMAYFMLGLETVAEHVEELFGDDEDDLDLDGLCDVIDGSVRDIPGGTYSDPNK